MAGLSNTDINVTVSLEEIQKRLEELNAKMDNFINSLIESGAQYRDAETKEKFATMYRAIDEEFTALEQAQKIWVLETKITFLNKLYFDNNTGKPLVNVRVWFSSNDRLEELTRLYNNMLTAIIYLKFG